VKKLKGEAEREWKMW